MATIPRQGLAEGAHTCGNRTVRTFEGQGRSRLVLVVRGVEPRSPHGTPSRRMSSALTRSECATDIIARFSPHPAYPLATWAVRYVVESHVIWTESREVFSDSLAA